MRSVDAVARNLEKRFDGNDVSFLFVDVVGQEVVRLTRAGTAAEPLGQAQRIRLPESRYDQVLRAGASLRRPKPSPTCCEAAQFTLASGLVPTTSAATPTTTAWARAAAHPTDPRIAAGEVANRIPVSPNPCDGGFASTTLHHPASAGMNPPCALPKNSRADQSNTSGKLVQRQNECSAGLLHIRAPVTRTAGCRAAARPAGYRRSDSGDDESVDARSVHDTQGESRRGTSTRRSQP